MDVEHAGYETDALRGLNKKRGPFIDFSGSFIAGLPNEYVKIILQIRCANSRAEMMAIIREYNWTPHRMAERSWLLDAPCGLRLSYVVKKRFFSRSNFDVQRLSYESQGSINAAVD